MTDTGRTQREGDLAEIVRVLRPAAPLAVGLWGGLDLRGTTR
ncbi:hypothetical protein [Pseudonocardia cypriaca]|nr:hypothetical protein [Pseudonocardia cypriaca]